MPSNPQLLLVAATLLCSCAPHVNGSRPGEIVGVSSGPPAEPEAAVPLPSRPAPSPNQELLEDAPEETVAAYEHLLVTTDLALGDECGPELGSTSTWRALSVLVHDRRAPMLWDLATRGSTAEARSAAIIGLAKLRVVSHSRARDLLRRQRGTIVICKGAERSTTRPYSAAQFLPRRLDGDSTEVAMP